jgi:hypothetical protein
VLVRPSNAEVKSCEGFWYQTWVFAFITNSPAYQLNRGTRDLIDASPTIQYRIELFATSLEDDPRKTSVVVADRRVLLKQYHSRWDTLQEAKRRTILLPTHTKRVLEGDILGCVVESGDDKVDVHFTQLPSISRGVRLGQWMVRGLPKCNTLKINPEVDLLVVPEVVKEGGYVTQSFTHLHGGDS